MPNLTEIEETFCGRKDVRTDEHLRLTLLGRLRRVDLIKIVKNRDFSSKISTVSNVRNDNEQKYVTYFCTGTFNKCVQMNVAVFKIRLHVVVVVAVPRREDDAVFLGSAEVDDDVVGVRDLRRLNVDLQVHVLVERHNRRLYQYNKLDG